MSANLEFHSLELAEVQVAFDFLVQWTLSKLTQMVE